MKRRTCYSITQCRAPVQRIMCSDRVGTLPMANGNGLPDRNATVPINLTPLQHIESQSPVASPNGSLLQNDPFTRLHRHEQLICISDRVDQTLIFPVINDGRLLDDIVATILTGTSVLVVGEPGIGKRTLSLGVARRLHEMRQSGMSNGVISRTVYTLSLGRDFWSQAQGAAISVMQDRIREVFNLVQRAGPEKIVLCIDDLDVLSFVDALVLKQRRRDRPSALRDDTKPFLSTENMLRFLLFSKKVLCLCTCIKAAYNRLVAKDTYYDEKFSKSFRVFYMDEPQLCHSKQIVDAHRERIEAELDVIIRNDALRSAVAYAIRFLSHRYMPEKALDLLHEACSAAVHDAESAPVEIRDSLHVGGRVIVDKMHVGRLIRQWCGVSDDELERCYNDDEFR